MSTATWLAWRIEISPSTAREYVRVARALGGLHLVDEAFAAGKISYSKVRAVTRAATPETEQNFLDIAMHTTAAQIERLAAAYRRTRLDPAQPNLDVRRFARRSETRGGMVRIDIQLPPEQANVVWEAMLAAMDAGRSEDGALPRRRGARSTRACWRPSARMRWSASLRISRFCAPATTRSCTRPAVRGRARWKARIQGCLWPPDTHRRPAQATRNQLIIGCTKNQ